MIFWITVSRRSSSTALSWNLCHLSSWIKVSAHWQMLASVVDEYKCITQSASYTFVCTSVNALYQTDTSFLHITCLPCTIKYYWTFALDKQKFYYTLHLYTCLCFMVAVIFIMMLSMHVLGIMALLAVMRFVFTDFIVC